SSHDINIIDKKNDSNLYFQVNTDCVEDDVCEHNSELKIDNQVYSLKNTTIKGWWSSFTGNGDFYHYDFGKYAFEINDDTEISLCLENEFSPEPEPMAAPLRGRITFTDNNGFTMDYEAGGCSEKPMITFGNS